MPSGRNFRFRPRWHYDLLWGLDYLRRAGVQPDQRAESPRPSIWWRKNATEPVDWPLENPHAGQVHFDMEEGAGCKPSRWNTLRRLRVLDWYSKKRD